MTAACSGSFLVVAPGISSSAWNHIRAGSALHSDLGAGSEWSCADFGGCAQHVDKLARRGAPFRGALYAGLMLTPEGPVLIECNARFGDPEIQVLLPRLAVPLGPLLYGAAQGDLATAVGELGLNARMLPTTGDAAVAIVLAAANYPDTPRKGDAISGLDEAARSGATVFHAGTVRAADGHFNTNGGRVLAVVGTGATISSARRAAVARRFAVARRLVPSTGA